MPVDYDAFIAIPGSRFEKTDITNQQSKSSKLLSAIPNNIIMQIRDNIIRQPTLYPYDVLRDAFVKLVAIDEKECIQIFPSRQQL